MQTLTVSNALLNVLRDRTDIKGPAKAILFVLADHANDSGQCWLSHASIAKESGLGKSTVRKHIKILGSLNEIKWTDRFTPEGDRDSNLYLVTLGGMPPRSTPPPRDSIPMPRHSAGVCHEVTEGVPPRSYKAPRKHPKEAPNLFDDAETLPFPSQDFRESWNEWVQHRREIKKPLTPLSVKQQLRNFAEWGEARSIAAIRFTIGKGWQGIQEPGNGGTPPAPAGTIVTAGRAFKA